MWGNSESVLCILGGFETLSYASLILFAVSEAQEKFGRSKR